MIEGKGDEEEGRAPGPHGWTCEATENHHHQCLSNFKRHPLSGEAAADVQQEISDETVNLRKGFFIMADEGVEGYSTVMNNDTPSLCLINA